MGWKKLSVNTNLTGGILYLPDRDAVTLEAEKENIYEVFGC